MSSEPDAGGGVGASWYRVAAIPDAGYGGSAERDYASVLPAVLDAAQHRRSFVTGWLSRGAGAPLELVTNAGPLPAAPDRPLSAAPAGGERAEVPGRPAAGFGPGPGQGPGQGDGAGQRDGQHPYDPPGDFLTRLAGRPGRPGPCELLFPWGARGVPCADSVVADLNRMVWAPCHGRQAPLLPGEPGGVRRQSWAPGAAGGAGRGAVAGGGSSWLAGGSGLAAATPTLFEVALTTLMGRPFGWLVVAEPTDLIDAVIAAKSADQADGSAVPFAATAGVLAALTGLPRREVPGLRLLDVGYFDVTAEPPGQDDVGVGTILDGQDRAVGELSVPLATLNRHALITGATGSGKSQTVRHLLEQLTRSGIPWLVVEPVKSEYAAMAGRIASAGGKLTLLSPADPDAVPLAVNPLAPEPGYPVQAHIDMVRALFLAAFDAHEPFPQIMSQALQRVYESCGWDPVSGAGLPGAVVPPAVPTLAQLQAAAIEVITDVGYGPELQADVRGFVDVRLRSLRTGSAGRFFEGGHPADVGELLARNAVLAIEDVANDEDKAFLIGTLIIRIVEHLRLRARSGRPGSGNAGRMRDAGGVRGAAGESLRHVIVIEEAHRLLRAGREGASAHAVELFASLLAEIRAYGEGLVIAEQIPAKLVPDVVKNTALKVLHRLPAHDDRQVVGAAMNLDDDQSRQVVSLQPGVAAVFADGMDRPLRIRVPFGGARERLRPAAEDGQDAADGDGFAIPVRGRRSAACGPVCVSGRACNLLELRAADLLADSAEDAWVRIWAEALMLAFLTNRPLPVVPAALRSRWAGLDPRLRECLLATATDRSLQGRALVVRAFYDPERLSAAIAATALKLLDGGSGAGA